MPTISGINYFASGSERHDGAPVLLLHGAGGNRLYWPPQIRRLPGQRVFAIDLPGHGESAGLGRQSIQGYTDDVLAFISEMRLNRAVLVGHSMGGAIALDAAIRFPGRVLGLVLVGAGARLRVDPQILHKTSQEETFPAAVNMIGERSFYKDAAPRLKELAIRRMSEMRPAVLFGDLSACDAFDCTDQLPRIDMPVTILCGQDDGMTPPKYSRFLHDNIRGSELHLIEAAGHMVMLEQPDPVAALLTRFVDSIGYKPGR